MIPASVGLTSSAGVEALQSSTHILSTIPPNGDFNQDPVSPSIISSPSPGQNSLARNEFKSNSVAHSDPFTKLDALSAAYIRCHVFVFSVEVHVHDAQKIFARRKLELTFCTWPFPVSTAAAFGENLRPFQDFWNGFPSGP